MVPYSRMRLKTREALQAISAGCSKGATISTFGRIRSVLVGETIECAAQGA